MRKLAAFWQQMLPIIPVLPVLPTHKYLSVNNLAFDPYHGMEEAISTPPDDQYFPTRPSSHPLSRTCLRVAAISRSKAGGNFSSRENFSKMRRRKISTLL